MGIRLQRCRGDVPWADLDVDAAGKRDFVSTCQRQWDDVSGAMGQREVQLALKECAEAQQTLDALGCDEVMALYTAP